MITLRWAPFPGADVVSYRVYRSMVGFSFPVVSLGAIAGLTLQLRMNGGPVQTITFDGTTPAHEKINVSLTGGMAYPSLMDSVYTIVRSDVRSGPNAKIQIIGGTALTALGLTARLITEKSEDVLVASVPALVDTEALVEFEDSDGVCQDWYTVSTVSSTAQESAKAPYKQPVTHTGQICVLEGIVTDLQGKRVADAEVTAQLVRFPQETEKASQVTLDPIVTQTGSDGRFSLAILQGTLVQLEIPAVGFSRNITVPDKAYEFITDIRVDLDYRYPLGYPG